MKKIYSFALALLTLFSCVVFSACADKYRKLNMSIFNNLGDRVDEVRLVIDDNLSQEPGVADEIKSFTNPQTMSVEFKGVDTEDIGQILVYSIPNDCVTVSNYTYTNNMCYFDIVANKRTVEDSTLVVTHLSSGKKKILPLTIDKKSHDLTITNENYLVSIPEKVLNPANGQYDDVVATHYLKMKETLSLTAESTDQVFFKFANQNSITGVEPILASESEGFENIYSGFKVSSATIANDVALKIYPVTYLEGYEIEEHQDELISVWFKRTLNENNVAFHSSEEVDFNNIQLIAKDDKLDTFKLSLQHLGTVLDSDLDDEPLSNLNFFTMYEIQNPTIENNDPAISALVDSSHNIFITAHEGTNKPLEVSITLKPINFVGDIYPITLSVKAKGELKSDKITALKDGVVVNSPDVNIFDYYETGTSLGSQFVFNSGEGVYHGISRMRMLVKKDILSPANNDSEGVTVGDKLYILLFSFVERPIRFTYDENRDLMVSEIITNETKVYVKYVTTDPEKTEPTEFGVTIETVNESGLSYWESLEPTTMKLNFLRLEGVKSMELQAGYFFIKDDGANSHGKYEQVTKLNRVYLNRLDGLDRSFAQGETQQTYFLYVKDTVVGMDGGSIPFVDFTVVVTPLQEVKNPLGIYPDEVLHDGESIRYEGLSTITYAYSDNLDDDVIGLVFRKNTDLGDYRISFYQENVFKESLICTVYEDLTSLDKEDIAVPTDKKLFEAGEYADKYKADYIVASGTNRTIDVIIPQAVLDSNVVTNYTYEYKLGVKTEGTLDEFVSDEYFKITADGHNYAKLWFEKGTFINEKIQYVYFTAVVETKSYLNIVTQSPQNKTTQVEIVFFIFNEIVKEDISINHKKLEKYPSDMLGYDYKEESRAELQILMDEDLWKYVTTDSWITWNINGSNLVYDEQAGTYIFNQSGVRVRKEWLDKTACNFEFVKISGETSYVRTIKAYVTQFDEVFELVCTVYVEDPIITERVVVTSDVSVTNDEYRTNYINMKLGGRYQVLADNISSKGKVTHPEIFIKVVDKFGSSFNTKEYFEINTTTSEIVVIKVDNLSEFQIIVFAKDALTENISPITSGFNYPSASLMEGYKNAYCVINIFLSNGTKNNPYLINNAYDFWQIDDELEYRSAHYQLMDNISLDNVADASVKSSIEDFTGYIGTYRNIKYTVDGIYLNNEFINLFKNFSGNLSNIKFVVQFAYNNPELRYTHLGLLDVNKGTITNVSLDVSGNTKLDEGTFYFGGLVAENLHEIKYTSGEGVSGNVTLSGSAKVYFGGLVGHNRHLIDGCEPVNNGEDTEIILNITEGRQNVLSQISIASSLSNSESAVGGVVGWNKGGISNAFVQSFINAPLTDNIGGVIGKNEHNEKAFLISLTSGIEVLTSEGVFDIYTWIDDSYSITNVKSASTIKAHNNVGGIVGFDKYGIYIDSDYQILTVDLKTPAIEANDAVGGIAGSSEYGKFVYCSVMSYNWNYSALKIDQDKSTFITDVCDILGNYAVGGIVGSAKSSTNDGDYTPLGEGYIADKTFVLYSSVNAYLSAEETNPIGGILTSNDGNAIIYSTYFIGKIDGTPNYKGNLILDDNTTGKESFYNAVYTLNLTNDGTNTIKEGKYPESGFNISSSSETTFEHALRNFWAWNSDINGGYIFVTRDETSTENSLPIFDLAPETIDVTVKNPSAVGLERVLLLNYYDFSIAENATDDVLLSLIEFNNRNQYIFKQDGSGLLNIKAYPENIGTVVVSVKSTNSSVVDIAYDGRLIIHGIGECELVFSSILNPNAGELEERTIKVIVDYPIGTEFNISTTRSESGEFLNGKTHNMGLNTTKQFYIITKGETRLPNSEIPYAYKTKSSINLKVEITYTTADETFNIADYLGVSGRKNLEESIYSSGMAKLVMEIDDLTPFMISIKNKLESGLFNIKVIPYIIVNGVKVADNSKTVNFSLSTLEGVTNVAFSYDEAIVYPNDVVYLSMYLSTDKKLETVEEIIHFISFISSSSIYSCEYSLGDSYVVLTKVGETPTEIGRFTFLIENFNDYENDIQKIVCRFEFDEININDEIKLELRFTLGVDVFESVQYTILPQRINKIEIKNYYYKNVSDGENGIKQEKVQQNILKPNEFGEMIVDIVPDNGYYDYLEISDITGTEEIKFIQVDELGNALSVKYDPSSDGKGIKLYDYSETKENTSRSRIYIKTQISNTYSSRMHTVEIRAYSSNGTMLASNRYEIDVKMLPQIQSTYLLPDGRSGSVAGNAQGQISNIGGLFLAEKVHALFRVETINANTDIEYEVNNSKYEIVKDVNNFYTLQPKGSYAESGEKVKVTFRTYAILENGDFDVAECSMEFTIAEFVVHGVSVNSSIKNDKTKEIYGYFDKDIDLEFYFGKTDISYYDTTSEGKPYWDTEYINNPDMANQDSTLGNIFKILRDLNNKSETNQYLVLNENTKTDGVYGAISDADKITLNNNKLSVREGYNQATDKYLAITFKMVSATDPTPAKHKWEMQLYTYESATNNYLIDENYKLNFRRATQWFEPTVIDSEEEFKEMASGGRYILNADLTLTYYTPIDAHLIEFDGNGHTITIESFDSFNNEVINAGLFAQIYDEEVVGETVMPAMIVKNLKVVYAGTLIESTGEHSLGTVSVSEGVKYADICNSAEVKYTKANFGGLAGINNGIITNCVVEGLIALRAGMLEQQITGEGYKLNFNIAGMVAENTKSGYITNSISKLKIFAQANIGGFVGVNSGKISSSGVDGEATIYGYNSELSNTIVVDIGGFAVENSGAISMCYVNLQKGTEKLTQIANVNIYSGTMSAKDFSAGLVNKNGGEISDCYVQMSSIGINNNRFAGLVNTNSGVIKKSYTYINGGIKSSKDDDMFVAENTGRVIDSIEFVVEKRTKIVEGLNSIDASNRTDKSYYENVGFAFGDNENAVWTISAGKLPKLVATEEFTFDKFKRSTISLTTVLEDGVWKEKYKVNYATYGSKESPYIVSDIDYWTLFFNPELNLYMTGYYRVVKDINFGLLGANPNTSLVTFSGNIQGNSMTLQNILLYYSDNELSESLGVFKSLIGVNDKSIANAVRNLKLNATSVWASSTKMVGVLAGLVENFKLYNIHIDSPDVVMVGANAVGGVAGVIRGSVDVDQISSNIGASSTRASTLRNYSIYMSRNNGEEISENLNQVYYAGSIAGIVDAYDRMNFNVNSDREITEDYYRVNNITVEGSVAQSGDTVGGAFGLIGELVYVNRLTINISGLLLGAEYSAGAVGENRGIIDNARVVLADNIFEKSQYVSAGVVGLNLGGLVRNSKVVANILKSNYSQTSGGIVGRNVNGVVASSMFDGELVSYYAGGIIGANYSDELLTETDVGTGSINAECKFSLNLIPSEPIKYYENNVEIKHLSNVSLTLNAFKLMIDNSSKFYTYQNDATNNNELLTAITVRSKVLGVVVGLNDGTNIVNKDGEGVYDINYDLINNVLVFNSGETAGITLEEEKNNVVLKDTGDDLTDVKFNFKNVNVLNVGAGKAYVMYLVGTNVSTFDSWIVYSGDYVLVE